MSLVLLIACSSKAEPPRREPPVGDGPARTVETREPEPGPGPRTDPESSRVPARPAQARAVRPIEVLLRSSPPGALAAVDGAPVGQTPAYWAGDADGREHEFTFVLPGYASARYRFVPITSGVIHARLEVLADDNDAGVPAELLRAPGMPVEPLRSPPVPDAAPTPTEAAQSQGAGPQP